MAHPALLRNNIFIVLLFILIQGCFSAGSDQSLNANMDKAHTELRNGVMYLDGDVYTGHLYRMNKNGHDSLYSAFYRNGLQNGWTTKWFEDGSLMERRCFEKNIKTGVHTGFWPNGNKRFLYRFVNGFYEGTQSEWFESGKQYRRKNYLNGQEDGLQQEWTETGSLIINYETHDGRQYGNIGKKHCASVWRDTAYTRPAK